jgi:alpha,alpha-trehalose phosphorylase (configuration-retaining)
VAHAVVHDIGRPLPAVHEDEASPSEDFFTVGNAARWMLLWSLLDGRGLRAGEVKGLTEDDFKLLTGMGLPPDDGGVGGQAEEALGGKEAMKKWNKKVVWEMLMGLDILEGEGVVL